MRYKKLFKHLENMPLKKRVEEINKIRLALHDYSPFKKEPVDCVIWVESEQIKANDYNPNTVAPPEMELLKQSILQDGYTQPIVSWKNRKHYEVVDGFHRNRVGKESPEVRERVNGYLPVTIVNDSRLDRGDRIASTIRHNRARGKHRVDAMADIVVELKRRNWSEEKIAKNLGMDADEVLRLCQITGMAEAFENADFSKSWDIGFEENIEKINFESKSKSPNRIYHTWDKWECYPAGFYENQKEGKTDDECRELYRGFLSDLAAFRRALIRVTSEWKNSCEHYLTNEAMNRIAWLGQASACISLGLPSKYRSGYFLLTEEQQKEADKMALRYLNKWLQEHDRETVDLEEAGVHSEVNLY